MKIVHYLPRMRLEEGGVVRAVLDLTAQMAARGHTVTLVTIDDHDVPAEWPRLDSGAVGAPPRPGASDGVPRVLVAPKPSLPGSVFSSRQLRAIRTVASTCDALHLHTPWERVNLQLASIARRAGKRYIVSLHGMLDEWCMTQGGLKKRLYLRLAGRRFLERAAAVHCTAEAEKTQAQPWYRNDRTVVIPLIFDLAAFRTLPGPEIARRKFGGEESAVSGEGVGPSSEASRAPPLPPTLLFLSRLHPKKGVEHLIDAAAILRDRGVNFRVHIAGAGDPTYEAALRERVSASGLGGRVSFLGMVTGVEKVSLYQAADVFVLPTSQENFGFVLPEALACGTPVVTTRGVDIWPDLENSGAAVVVHPLSSRGLADAVAGLLADPTRRRTMGRVGREWVFRSLDPAHVVRGYETLYATAAGVPDVDNQSRNLQSRASVAAVGGR